MQPNSEEIERIIEAALREDIGTGDATTDLLVDAGLSAQLAFIARQPLVACGTALVPRVFSRLDRLVNAEPVAADGEKVEKGQVMLRVKGPARAILTGERVALNLLQRMCAVATLTAAYVDAVRGTKAQIMDTRKTMPGLRVVDKYAVRAGGGHNHRIRLDDAILVKDNHLALCGGIAATMARIRQGNVKKLPVILECDTLAQVEEGLKAGADILLLDNMDNAMLTQAVAMNQGRVLLEASGNVSLETIRAIAETGVDRISIGRITHSAPNVDIGLDVVID